MNEFPKKLKLKLDKRDADSALRQLNTNEGLVDFSSNDYLGFAQNKDIFNNAQDLLTSENIAKNGSGGSRLLTGNHMLYRQVEAWLCDFHQSDAAIILNSGYDANLGFFSSVPQRGDIVFYDEFIHASIRDGIVMSHAKSYKFKHNDLKDLKQKWHAEWNRSGHEGVIYIVTESVFSMDGDSPNLKALADFCLKNTCHLVVDEAHAIGVYGETGEGLIQQLELQDKIFARVVTFGKGLGVHGAAILGSKILKQYLVNFSRPFIYTTALPPHTLATIKVAYEELDKTEAINKLKQNITFFKEEVVNNELQDYFIESHSAIHSCLLSGNKRIKSISNQLNENGFDVKAILSPTIPEGQERLRFCLHAYNTEKDIKDVLDCLMRFING